MIDRVLDIVERYVDTRIKKSGDGQILVRCPFHKGGMERKPSFSVSLNKGLFNCFTCHESGTIATLLTMLGHPPSVVEREVGPLRDEIKRNLENLKLKKQAQYQTSNPFRAPVVLPESMISAFDWLPVQLQQQGFDPAWLQWLRIGVDMKNQRITYPVRDIYGNLAGFVGGRTRPDQEPKYKVYRGRMKTFDGRVIPSEYGLWFDEEYPTYDFQNHEYLWNYHNVYPRALHSQEVSQIIIVEGFKACIWMLQNGYRDTVALMGSKMSARQKELLLRVNARIVLFLDNNAPGQDGALKAGLNLQQAIPEVYVARYPDRADSECQPDWLDSVELQQAINNATQFRIWKRGRVPL